MSLLDWGVVEISRLLFRISAGVRCGVVLVVICALYVGCRAGDGSGGWGNDLLEAKTRAKTEGRMILLNFTSSDSCEWCQRFRKEILNQEEFIEFSKRSLVLVELDYPKDEKRQSASLKRANAELKERYLVRGYPTFVLLDSNGDEVGRQVGYLRGGPGAFIQKLRSFAK